MTSETRLDLHDIQGAVLKGFGRHGFPFARYLVFVVHDEEAGRSFVRSLVPKITTSAPWRKGGSLQDGTAIPAATTNIAFTYHGLRELGVPRASLQSFPDEFAMGMRARRDILGDDGPSAPEVWDPVWQREDQVHVLVWINAQSKEALEQRYAEIRALVPKDGKVELCKGHRAPGGRVDLDYQDAGALLVDGKPSAKEHFGYTDGISNPYFKGALVDEGALIGGGKPTGHAPETAAGWEALATGEFLLGHEDEAGEYPEAPIPSVLAMNGTFMVVRKLHENTKSFDDFLAATGGELPGGAEELAAKLAGRWRNGAPITRFPSKTEADSFGKKYEEAKLAIASAKTKQERDEAKRRFADLSTRFVAFDYGHDLDGGRCPVGAHTRRTNPRGALEFGKTGAFETRGAVDNRRRVLRRGLPYGESVRDRSDQGDHGIVFMGINASLRRQFEFVQQQWVNYGNDFKLGSDKDPLAGNHSASPAGEPAGRMLIETAKDDPRPPIFCGGLPRLVETRGGDYFFIPGMNALRMIAAGTIDPT